MPIQSVIGNGFVGVNLRPVFHVRKDFVLECFALNVRYNSSADGSLVAIQHSHDDRLATWFSEN
jgi:hypothetical protein